ncbi:MAG: type VI secretion system Vgr family protein [Acinetobacter sp.]
MLRNINILLERFGLGMQKRAIHVHFSNQALNANVFLQCIQGTQHINQGLKAELLCLSTNANIALKQFIGCQVAVDQVTDFGELYRTTGIVTGASQGQSDGALTVYKITLEDATSLWHKRRNSRVFMNKSVVEISEILFKEWQTKSALFASSLSLDCSGLRKDYDIRPLIVQINETDHQLLTRLWRSEGLSWLIDESASIVPVSATQIQAQKLRLIDDNSQYQAMPRRNIRFHRSHAAERFDTITSLIAQRSIQSTAIQVQRWQADYLLQDQTYATLSHHQHSEQQDNETLSLEQAWTLSPAWTSDLNGEDQTTRSSSTQLDKLNTQLIQYQELQSKYFTAISSVRDAQVGYWFELKEHPEIDQHESSDREFLITGKTFYNQNNLPKELHDQLSKLLNLSYWSHLIKDQRQANELSLVRRKIPIVPEYNPLVHRPAVFPQRAKVVGPEGETIYVDQWGRIKVRFLFTRTDDNWHDCGAGSNDNDTDSAWVDVLTPWAGEGYGTRFHPRIGEIVVIDFFDGNVDRPFVVGRLHEAERYQTKFDGKGQLPDTKKLSGIRSSEVNGSGFNQLRFDDTTGQISAQLQSSHAATQLNLGNLSHPKDKASSDGRGEGFELRTDAYGAMRAGKGMLISTYAQENALAEHLDSESAKQQLEGSHDATKALSELAKNQQTDAIESLDKLKMLAENIQEDIAKFNKAVLILNAPEDIALTTPKNIHLSADGQINSYAGDTINTSTQNNLIIQAQSKASVFAVKGIDIISAQENIAIHAQNNSMDIFSKHGLTIASTEDSIYLIAKKKLRLVGGASEIELAENIVSKTGGYNKSHAGQHEVLSGEHVPMPQIGLPTMETPYSNKIDYSWSQASDEKKEILIVDQKDNNLIKIKTDQLDTENNISSLRFYTPSETNFFALGFNSSHVYIDQKQIDAENEDELLVDALGNEENDDDVYTEEDSY